MPFRIARPCAGVREGARGLIRVDTWHATHRDIGLSLADGMIRALTRLPAGEGIDVGDLGVPDVVGRIAEAVVGNLPADSATNGNG